MEVQQSIPQTVTSAMLIAGQSNSKQRILQPERQFELVGTRFIIDGFAFTADLRRFLCAIEMLGRNLACDVFFR